MLFHKDVRLPEWFRLPARTVNLVWSKHAAAACLDDRYGLLEVCPVLNLGQCETIEVEVTDNWVTKLVLRTAWDDEHDVVFVVIPRPAHGHYFVKTVWLNHKNDTHRTLDRSKYVQ